MKLIKKIQRTCIALAIIATLVLLASPTAAAINNEFRLNYDDIERLVTRENRQLEIMRRNFDLLVDARADMRDMRDGMAHTSDWISGINRSLNSASQAASNAAANAPADMVAGLTAMGDIADALAGAMLVNQAAIGTINFDNIDMQIGQTTVIIEQTTDTLTNTAQGMFVMHHQLQTQLRQMATRRSLLEDSLRLAQVAHSAGTGTRLEALQAELALSEFDNQVSQLENQSQLLINNLKMLVGWQQNEPMILGPLPAPNRNFAANVNINEDTATAIRNSYSLRILQQEFNFTERERQHVIRLNMDLTREQIALNLRNQHILLQQQTELLSLEEQRLTVATQQLEQARRQLELGVISQAMLQAEEANYQGQRNAVETARNTLFNEIANYQAMVAGLT